MHVPTQAFSRRSALRAGTALAGTVLLTMLAVPTVAQAATRRVAVRSRANNRYLTGRLTSVVADATSVGSAQQFDVIDIGTGVVAFKSVATGAYVSAENYGNAVLSAQRPEPRSWETFRLVAQSDGSTAIRAEINQRWVSAENAGSGALIANRSAVGDWERFTLVDVGAVPPVVTQPTTPPTTGGRANLVPGTYRPGASTTGPLPGTALRTVNGDLTVTANGQVIENVEVWGSIIVGAFSSVVIRNSVIHGTTRTGQDTCCIYGKDDNLRGALIEDCRLVGRGNVWCSGVRGGNYTIRRSELTNLPDGICLTSQLGNVTVEGCWIHNGLYAEWTASTPNMPYAGNYYTHTDGVQFHRGSTYTIRGNMIGGTRVPGGVRTGQAAAINSGDDMYNAAFMIKQEVDNSAANRINNVLIEKNWLAGGMSTINIVPGRDNNFATTVVRNNRFIRSTWGTQHYILRTGTAGVFENNVFDDDGSPVPISRGA